MMQSREGARADRRVADPHGSRVRRRTNLHGAIRLEPAEALGDFSDRRRAPVQEHFVGEFQSELLEASEQKLAHFGAT